MVLAVGEPVVAFDDAGVWHENGPCALAHITLTIRAGEHWAVLGPNGAGKSTLLGLAAASRLASSGHLDVLGSRLGRVDLRELRERIGIVDVRLRMPSELSVLEYVLTGATQTVVPRAQRLRPEHRIRATGLLRLVGLDRIADRSIGVCSQGERARARLGRALMPDPALLVLDEPAAGLDLPGRADLLEALTTLASAEPALTTIAAVHHLEELAPTTTHVALLAGGRLLSSGLADEQLSNDTLLSVCFGRPVRAFVVDGRWYAVAAAQGGS